MAAAASSRIIDYLSADKVLASAVTLGCAAGLCDDYWEGAAPLNGQLRTGGCSLRGDQQLDLSLERCQELERNGYLVIDNFLTSEHVQNAVMSLEDERSLLQAKMNKTETKCAPTGFSYFVVAIRQGRRGKVRKIPE